MEQSINPQLDAALSRLDIAADLASSSTAATRFIDLAQLDYWILHISALIGACMLNRAERMAAITSLTNARQTRHDVSRLLYAAHETVSARREQRQCAQPTCSAAS